ncbi:MAG: response regulator [Bacteroidetes bacterium]|nr:response regulator [Bacteroidota bacterium]
MKQQEIEILLVEDNENDAEMTILALKGSKVSNQILHLKNGVQALDYLFSTGEHLGRVVDKKPKVILLDLKMPKVNGIEVLTAIKSNPLTKEISVVILTSSKEDPDIKTCYALGANSYIVKPVDFEEFHKAVADLGVYWLLLNQPPV